MGEPDELEARLAGVLRRCVGDFRALESVERLSGGASQETYCVVVATGAGTRKLALRRSPGGVADALRRGPGPAAEALLMRSARAAGVPEPEVVCVLEPGDGLGEGFLMEWLEGETLGARIVRAPELAGVRPRLAHQCGEILARIHAIDLEQTGLAGRLSRSDPAELVGQTWERYRSFGTPQPMIDYAGRWLLEHLPQHPDAALVHGDFRNGNLMVGPEGVRAVLDWELAHTGDPMRDLGWLCTRSWRYGRRELPVGGFGRREDLFAAYEAASGQRVNPEHVRFWEVFGSFWWAVGCLEMAQHYRSGPDRSVERPAIGRRSSECQLDCANLLIAGPVLPAAPDAAPADPDVPRLDELLASVRDFLRDDVMGATGGRTRFLARVAANSLDIVARDLASGPEHRRRELARLRELFGGGGDLATLRWKLVHGLRDGSIPLDRPGLAEHLRATAVDRVAIDQPGYAGLAAARERA